MTDLQLEVKYDTVRQVLESSLDLSLDVQKLAKSLDSLIDIHDPRLENVDAESIVRFLGCAQKQTEIYLRLLSVIKSQVNNIDFHLRSYNNICSLAIKELKENEK